MKFIKKIRVLSRKLNKKTVKLSLLGISLFGLLTSSNISLAKYITANYGNANAGAAKFGSFAIDSNMAPINVPEDAPTGWYAFVATFKVSFTEGEVKRNYTLLRMLILIVTLMILTILK